MGKVHVAEAAQFEFLKGIPESERSISVLDVLNMIEDRCREKGPVVTMAVASRILGVTPQRVQQLAEAGKLETFRMEGVLWVHTRSLAKRFVERQPKPSLREAFMRGWLTGKGIAESQERD
jgi:hypothetical protein